MLHTACFNYECSIKGRLYLINPGKRSFRKTEGMRMLADREQRLWWIDTDSHT